MAYEGLFEAWTIKAAADLSDLTPGTGALYKAVNMKTGGFSSSGAGLNGILTQAGASGDHVTLAMYGFPKAVFATAITSIGMELTINGSGFMTLAASGDYVIGHNVTAVSCYAVGPIAANFLNPWRRTN